MMILVLLLSGLLVSSTPLPTGFLSEPSSEHPFFTASLSPWTSLVLDVVDAFLRSAQTAADGQTFRMSKLLEDIHSVMSNPSQVASLRMAAVPYWMNNCQGMKTCKQVLATDFIKPCYRRGVTLDAIVQDFGKQISFLDFKSLHSLHPKRLANVQLPVQLLLLRTMEAMSVLSADEWREVLGRTFYALSVWTDILFYFLNNGIRDVRDGKEHLVNEAIVTEMKNCMDSMSSFMSAINEHGLTGLFESTAAIAQSFTKKLATNYGIKMGAKKQEPIQKYTKLFVSPPKFAAFVLSYVDHFAKMLGFNGHIDLSQVQLDMSTEMVVGMTMDYLKLFYAMLQGIVEQDAATWMAENQGDFGQYIKHLKQSDGHEAFDEDDLHTVVQVLLRDKRQRRWIKHIFLFFANLIKYQGGPIIGNEATQQIVAFLDDPFSADQKEAFIWTFLKGLGLKFALNRFDIATRLFGFRLSEWDALFLFTSKIIGNVDAYWDDSRREQVAALRLPQWTWTFDRHVDLSTYLIKIWTALTPPQVAFVPDVLMLPQSLEQLLEHSAPYIDKMVSNLPEGAERHHVDDDIIAVFSTFSNLASIVTTLHLQGKVSEWIINSMGLQYANLNNDLSLLLSDLATLDPKRCKSKMARFMVNFYIKFMVIHGAAAGWRSEKEAKMRLLWELGSVSSEDTPFTASLLPRFVIRFILSMTSVTLIWLSVSMLKAPKGTRSLRKAIKWD